MESRALIALEGRLGFPTLREPREAAEQPPTPGQGLQRQREGPAPAAWAPGAAAVDTAGVLRAATPAPRVSDSTLTAIYSCPVPGAQGHGQHGHSRRASWCHCPYLDGSGVHGAGGGLHIVRTPPRVARPVCTQRLQAPVPPLPALSAGPLCPPSRCVWLPCGSRIPPCLHQPRHVSVRLTALWGPRNCQPGLCLLPRPVACCCVIAW